MISLGAIEGIIVVSLVMVLSPGPNMIYLVSRSLAQGRRAGMISLAGIGIGFFIYLSAAVAGITAIFTLVPVVYDAIKIAGTIYLIWIAWKTVRPGGSSVFETRELSIDPIGKLFGMGVMSTLLNPKIAIMYTSLIPQFVNVHKGGIVEQSLMLGLIQISISLSIDALYVIGAGSIARFLSSRPKWMRAQRYAMGLLLAGFAIRVATA